MPRLMLTITETGLLVFKIIEADLAHTGVHIEVVMDDMLYPSYTSPKARTKLMTLNDSEFHFYVGGILTNIS